MQTIIFLKISLFPSCIFKFTKLEGRQHTGNAFLEIKRTLEKKFNINGQKISEQTSHLKI